MPASAWAFLVQDFSEGEISYKVKNGARYLRAPYTLAH